MTRTDNPRRQTVLSRAAHSLCWLASLALGFYALYLTVLHPGFRWLELIRLTAIALLIATVVWTRWLRSLAAISSTTGTLLLLMPLAELAVHLILMPHPGIAFPVALAVILLFESFFRTGGGR